MGIDRFVGYYVMDTAQYFSIILYKIQLSNITLLIENMKGAKFYFAFMDD